MAGSKYKYTFAELKNIIAEAGGLEMSHVDESVHYTDASKYAEQYYGETFRATTGLDNDWGDY